MKKMTLIQEKIIRNKWYLIVVLDNKMISTNDTDALWNDIQLEND